MKLSALILASTVSCVVGFTSQPAFRTVSTELMAEKKSLFRTIADMDLFAPKSGQNDYGARSGKKLSIGDIKSGSSYVPDGMDAATYNKIRGDAQKKKEANYAKNVKKAGVYIDYTKFYKDRGTDTSGDWMKSVTNGHEMVKTKYDWSGNKDSNAFVAGNQNNKKKKLFGK